MGPRWVGAGSPGDLRSHCRRIPESWVKETPWPKAAPLSAFPRSSARILYAFGLPAPPPSDKHCTGFIPSQKRHQVLLTRGGTTSSSQALLTGEGSATCAAGRLPQLAASTWEAVREGAAPPRCWVPFLGPGRPDLAPRQQRPRAAPPALRRQACRGAGQQHGFGRPQTHCKEEKRFL